jgi:hypothetical protein
MFEDACALEGSLAPTPPGAERRGAVRYVGNRALLCDVTVGEGGERWTARIHDVSATGIGLLLSRRPERGTILTLRFRPPTDQLVPPLEACVIHATREHPASPFVVGCAFANVLGPEELQALL